MSKQNGDQGSSPRQRYRLKMSKRQAKVYGIAIIALAIVFAFALLAAVGVINLPFGREFSHKIVYVEAGETPCVAPDARPVDADGMKLQVLNASSMPGVAGQVASAMENQGYQTAMVDNSMQPFRGNVQIEVSPASVTHAYTMARYFEEPVRIRISKLPNDTMTVILGESFHGVPSAEKMQAVNEDQSRLKSLDECLPVDPEEVAPQSSDIQSGEQSQ